MTRSAKIVCTLGPASSTSGQLAELVDAGMDVARLNFSHGNHVDHRKVYESVRQVSSERAKAVGVLADLQGPKIRLGCFDAGAVLWAPGEHVVITTDSCVGTHDRVCTTYAGLAWDVDSGDRLLVDDGRVELRVVRVSGADVLCEVVEGGRVSDHKGISLPGVAVGVTALSEKDVDDLRYALRLGVDMIAMSFVRTPEDVKQAHDVMDEVGKRVPVIAKLEKPEAVADLEGVVSAFDGIMVARGDLGVEMALERLPLVQKRVVQMCREMAKPVIVATHMLDSMVDSPVPTRAEVSDVANAVLDGADAVMLSAETSVGCAPAHTVSTMSRIVSDAESGGAMFLPALPPGPASTTPEAVAAAACEIATRLGAAALCCFTRTGETARLLARHHPPRPLLAFTPDDSVRARLALSWAVVASVLPDVSETDEMIDQLLRLLPASPWCKPGDTVVMVAGSPPGVAGSTNLLRVLRLDEPAHTIE